MKYVCEHCGDQLPVDRDVDNDQMFDYVVGRHLFTECPRKFTGETLAPAQRLDPKPAFTLSKSSY